MIESHLRSFRFPVKRCPTQSQAAKGRRSTESQGYESDAESIAMPSPTVFLTRNQSTGASRLITGGRADDRILPRRCQSHDFGRPRRGGIPISEEAVGSSDHEREPATPSQLHPYVRNLSHRLDRMGLHSFYLSRLGDQFHVSNRFVRPSTTRPSSTRRLTLKKILYILSLDPPMQRSCLPPK